VKPALPDYFRIFNTVWTVCSPRLSRRVTALTSESKASKKSFNACRRSTKKARSGSAGFPACSFFQRHPNGGNGPVEVAVAPFLQDGTDCPVEIRLGNIVIPAVTHLGNRVDQAQAGQRVYIVLMAPLVRAVCADEFIQRERARGKIQYRENGAHAFGETPKAADVAPAGTKSCLSGTRSSAMPDSSFRTFSLY